MSKNTRVTIVDYGLSNLLSVQRAVEGLGYSYCLTSDAAKVREAQILLLPGVGAFRDGMIGLQKLKLLEPIWGCAASGVPMLGICLGMQMLFDLSREFGMHRGLGLIPGKVERIPETDTANERQNVPHIGWSGLLPPDGERFTSPVLAGTQPADEVYFIHSYEVKPASKEHVLAECDYGGRRVCAVAGKDNVYGTQFHPEKSSAVGLKILKAFLGLSQ